MAAVRPPKSFLLSSELADYLVSHGTRPDAVQQALIEETATLGAVAGMQIAPEQGAFLTVLTRLIGARRAIEIGTFTGYSALCIARGLPADGRLVCCDVSEEWTAIGRRAWGAELGPDETPWEAGLGYAVKLDKPAAFIGREALQRQKTEDPRKRLVLFSFDDPGAFPWGGEPILMDGRNVGELTSAGFSRKHGRAIAMGYARAEWALTDQALVKTKFEIDVAGELFAVTPRLKLP